MTVTRKDFEATAASIRSARQACEDHGHETVALDIVTGYLADTFAEANPRFDRSRLYAAAGRTEPEVPEDEDEDEEPEGLDLQHLIDTGLAWRLEGSIGRAAAEAIEAGICTLGPVGHRDFWGNYVPSRFEVAPGTLGSIEYAESITEGAS